MDLKETVEYKYYGYDIVTCPICGNETLDNFWICGHCGWEYDGHTINEEYSSTNNCTVEAYRKSYLENS